MCLPHAFANNTLAAGLPKASVTLRQISRLRNNNIVYSRIYPPQSLTCRNRRLDVVVISGATSTTTTAAGVRQDEREVESSWQNSVGS